MNLLIVGAGGHGRCCLDIARDMNRYDRIALLDDGYIDDYRLIYSNSVIRPDTHIGEMTRIGS